MLAAGGNDSEGHMLIWDADRLELVRFNVAPVVRSRCFIEGNY